MGVGIFAARKIALLNSINNLELMMTQLSSRQMQLSQQCMDISMKQNNLQLNMSQGVTVQQNGNMWGAAAQGAGMLGNALGGSQYGQLMGSVAAGGMAIASLFAGGSGSSSGTDPNAALKANQVQLDNQLLQLQQQQKRLELTMKQLETQLNMKNQELQSVEKGEEAAIKRSAPKYGE